MPRGKFHESLKGIVTKLHYQDGLDNHKLGQRRLPSPHNTIPLKEQAVCAFYNMLLSIDNHCVLKLVLYSLTYDQL